MRMCKGAEVSNPKCPGREKQTFLSGPVVAFLSLAALSAQL